MIKSLIAVLALTASAFAEPGKKATDAPEFPSCAPAAASCNKLPAKSTKACWSSISQAKIAISTCANPTSVSVVTVTETAKPKFWKTTTSAVTSTWTTTQNVNITVESTLVTTNIQTVTETITGSALATVSSAANVNITKTAVVSTTSTTTSTLIVDQSKETCQAKRAAGPVEKRGWNALPSDCSCFLTSTTFSGVQTYLTTTTTTPTVTLTKTVPTQATVTSTWTITVPVTSTSSSLTAEFTTSTTTLYVTQINTATWTVTSTETSTSVATKTATSTVDVCATAAPQSSKPSSPNVSAAGQSQVKSFAECCSKCYSQNNCVFYDFNPTSWSCTVYTNSKKGSCITDSCPKGKADVSVKKGNGDQFGAGPCAGAWSSS